MKHAMVYEWQFGAHIKLDPAVAGERMDAIKKRNRGTITPAAVLRDARSTSSVLHGYFEWSDKKAGEKYRLEQAGYLIRSLVVIVPAVKGKTEARGPIRAFVSIKKGGARSYVGVVEALSDTVMREQVLRDAMSELTGWRRRYNDLSEFSKIFSVIDKTQGDLGLAA